MRTTDIYNYFYHKEHDPLKAMGLCFFSYAWALVFLKREIAPFKFVKSDLGVVDLSINQSPDLVEYSIEPEMTDYLYFVWSKYRHYDGFELMKRIIKQPPYKEARKVITKKAIRKFYGRISSLAGKA